MKTTKKRVDILLVEGTKNPKKWMSVHGYVEPISTDEELCDADEVFWRDEWRKLRDHHLGETKVLFEVVEELRQRLLQK